MATATELTSFYNDESLLARVAVGVGKEVDLIMRAQTGSLLEGTSEPLTSQLKQWALRFIRTPMPLSKQLTWALLIRNEALTVAQINSATVAAIQTQARDIIPFFAAQEAAEAVEATP